MKRQLALLLTVWALACSTAFGQKFYPDDPLDEVPQLWPATDPQARSLSDILELFYNTTGAPGERHPERGVIAAGGVSTMGEVMDGAWYVNRHPKHRFSPEGLVRGPGDDRPPEVNEPWRVLTVKQYGYRPGILVADAENQLYLLRFDPKGLAEMATGAEMISSKLLYALGYNVPENYIVYFDREQLVLADGGESITSSGGSRDMVPKDIEAFLQSVASESGRYRAVATRVPGSWEGLLGPYQVYGTRSDDPNDVVPHEHRRDLRGLFVVAAWLNHNEMGAVNTTDIVVNRQGVPVVQHFLIDFFSTLGSGGTERKESWRGNEKTYDFDRTFKNMVGLGIYTPQWMRSHHPRLPATGRFGFEYFDPERWTPNAIIAPFANRLPDDTYWAARQIMSFTDDDIRTIVQTAGFSDPAAGEWIVKCLVERRNRIGATYFAKVLPIDNFRVEEDTLAFDDLGIDYGFVADRRYRIRWSVFDNQNETHERIGVVEDAGRSLPPQVLEARSNSYFAATIAGGEEDKNVVVYLRKETDGVKVVGLERNWPGKVIADAALDEDTGLARFSDLADVQKRLFESYTKAYNESTEFDLAPEDYFNSMTISERTTFDAVTHALMNSPLTGEAGDDRGNAIDLLVGIERIAGQYYGRSGDQQFRLYVDLVEGARETLEQSQEFALGHLNTVYHVGYPYSYRQNGTLPSIQFSVSEDSSKADIDVDYRSSKMPQAMFNGHLTSSNSDVRAGDNYEKHNGRWGGFVAWWQGVFGGLNHHTGKKTTGIGLLSQERKEAPTPLPPNRPAGSEPEELADAVQEFLTDWLVRRDIDEAMHFISDNALACVDTDDFHGDEVLTEGRAKEALAEAMQEGANELGDRDNLTEAIDVVLPWRASIRIMEHPFENDFALMELTNADAAIYLCGNPPVGGDIDSYGTYFATLFDFKQRGSAILGLLWTRENGHWRLVAWEAFQS